MNKKLSIMILSLLLIGIVSAHGYDYKEKISETKYFPKDHYAVSRTTYISYDNDNRHSTYDYRHGYSYRTTTEYLDEHYKKTKKAHRKYFDDDKKDYYSVYVPYLKKYEKRACYPSAPKGKLFYVRCP